MSSIRFVLYMVSHIVDTTLTVQFCLYKVVIGIVVDDKLNIIKVALTIGEQLGQFDTVSV